MDEWKDIPGYKGRYQINRKGDVRSLVSPRGPRKIPKLKNYTLNCRHTWTVKLTDDTGRQAQRSVASLMAEVWLGGVPKGMVAVHLNGDTADHRLENIGIRYRNVTNRRAVVKLDRDGRQVAWYPSTVVAAQENYVSASTVQFYCQGRNKGLFEGEYIFRYDSPKCKTGRKHKDD